MIESTRQRTNRRPNPAIGGAGWRFAPLQVIKKYTETL
jgi:hypothetical protein